MYTSKEHQLAAARGRDSARSRPRPPVSAGEPSSPP